MQLIKQAKTY